jgi:HPt (histidine-containing phosphotransfer) domain-containing protein
VITLDTTVLGELRVLDGEDLRDLVELYFADVVTQLGLLREALAAGNGDAVAASAHRIKGASLSIGAAGIAGVASELELAGKSGELAGAAQLISTIDSELDPTRTALSAELAVELPD